ncbi:hypothetical protein [Bifidobacterium callimiconis]|uniref:Uncharacterized protein n=1 Tax=Bifidobacterium callimiconis TaxID=2306973 RepID=A0A430F9A5_9BIFI|nr:hypothetical protein [Bifidobacterium callimiconis]RSX49416.1 hypothetical protein D2E23_2109 [Bifidobacterium callimiconis]
MLTITIRPTAITLIAPIALIVDDDSIAAAALSPIHGIHNSKAINIGHMFDNLESRMVVSPGDCLCDECIHDAFCDECLREEDCSISEYLEEELLRRRSEPTPPCTCSRESTVMVQPRIS